MRERDLRQLLHRHIDASESELDVVEGIGALNFLAIDDLRVVDEGEMLAPDTIVADARYAEADKGFALPGVNRELLDKIRGTRHRWFIFTDRAGAPAWALDSFALLRACDSDGAVPENIAPYCHRPVVITDRNTRLGEVIAHLKSGAPAQSDAPFPRRIMLYWGDEKRIVTASDIMGRLFMGIGVYSSATPAEPVGSADQR